MTIRSELDAKRRKTSILMILSFVIFAMGLAFSELHFIFKILTVLAFVGFIVEVFCLLICNAQNVEEK